MAGPEIRVHEPSALCSLGPRPFLTTGVLVQLLRQQFADGVHLEEPSLRGTAWEAGIATKIAIEDLLVWRPEETQVRPAIVVARQAWEVDRRGINDELMGELPADGVPQFANFLTGAHTVFALAPEGAMAERLAAEIYRTLNDFAPEIRRQFGFQRFSVAGVDRPHRLPEALDGWATPVNLAYAYEQRWRVEPHAPVLMRLGIDARWVAAV